MSSTRRAAGDAAIAAGRQFMLGELEETALDDWLAALLRESLDQATKFLVGGILAATVGDQEDGGRDRRQAFRLIRLRHDCDRDWPGVVSRPGSAVRRRKGRLSITVYQIAELFPCVLSRHGPRIAELPTLPSAASGEGILRGQPGASVTARGSGLRFCGVRE